MARALATVEESHRQLRSDLSLLADARRAQAAAREARDSLLARAAHASMRAATPRPAWAHPGAHQPRWPPTAPEALDAERAIVLRGKAVLSLEVAVSAAKQACRQATQAHHRAAVLHRAVREEVKAVEAAIRSCPGGSVTVAAVICGSVGFS